MNPNGGRLPVGGANAPPKLLTVRADALQMADGTPLKNIEKHRSQDVLCGRGGGTNHHVGNAHWRKLVNNNKRLYLSLPKKQKALVAKSIVHAVRAQNPPGRFLAKDPTNSLWCDIGDQKATEKTSQALREGAPDIRTEMAKEGQMERGNVIVGGGSTMLQNGLIGLDQNKSGAGKDNVPYAQAGMPPTNTIPSSQGGFPVLDGQGEDASMMMAFQQYLGGKNQNPSTATQPAPTLPTSTSPTKLSISQAPSLQHHQQPQILGALASRQLLNSDLAREAYQQTLMSRKMSGGARSVLDNPLMQTNPQHLNFGDGTMMSYDEFTQSVANRSRDGLQMANQAASAMRQQPSQIVSSIYNDGLWSVPTGIPLESQRMTDLLRSSSLSSASSLGRTNYLCNNKLTNNMLGNAANSIGKGSSLISQVGPNTSTLAKLLEQRKSLLTSQLKGSAMARLDPKELYSMSSLGLLSNPALSRESGQFSHLTPPSDIGQFVGNNGTGLTSLHPSVSAVMAQMKFQELIKKNREEASQLKNVVTQRLGHLGNMTTQLLGSPRDDAGTSIPTTSAPKRGVSATLDDLCRAAGLDDHQPSKPPSSLAEDLYKKDEEDQVLDFCNRVKTKKKPKTSMPKLGVNDSSLVDDDSEEDVIKYLTTKRKRADSNASAKEDSKRSKLITKGEEDSELDRFVAQKGLRDDLLSRGLSLNRNFSQKIRSLPLSETLLDRGHSLAMSEISLDRGQSLNEIGLMGDNDGQFDDASEEDEAPTFASKTAKVARAGTLGTINTFPLDM